MGEIVDFAEQAQFSIETRIAPTNCPLAPGAPRLADLSQPVIHVSIVGHATN